MINSSCFPRRTPVSLLAPLVLAAGLAAPSLAAIAPAAPQPASPQPTLRAAPADASAAPVSAEERRQVVERIAELLAERYVFEEVGRDAGEHIRRLLAEQGFDGLEDPAAFATALTEALQSVTRDKHMRVRPIPQGPRPGSAAGPGGGPTVNRSGAAPADPAERILLIPTPPDHPMARNFGFEQVQILPGNVGYLKLNGFAGDPAAEQVAAAAMNFLAGSDALIVDLRENGGGSPELIRFISSWLFEKPTHLNSLYFRETDETIDFWTHSEVPGGRRMAIVPIFVLTSNYTFSGGEEFAYNIQTQQRGTLIGETTGGGANPGGLVPAGDRFAIFIPTGRAINPITGTNWEGVGVKPDIEIPASEAYEEAVKLASTAAGKHRDERRQAALAMRSEIARELRQAASAAQDEAEVMTPGLRAALERAVANGALSEMALIDVSRGYLESGRPAPAMALMRFGTGAFPDSPSSYNVLGEALEHSGRLEEAQAAFRRAYEMGTELGRPQAELYKSNLDRVSGAIQSSR